MKYDFSQEDIEQTLGWETGSITEKSIIDVLMDAKPLFSRYYGRLPKELQTQIEIILKTGIEKCQGIADQDNQQKNDIIKIRRDSAKRAYPHIEKKEHEKYEDKIRKLDLSQLDFTFLFENKRGS